MPSSLILFENVGDYFFRNGLLRCEKKVIDNSLVAVPHWQRLGNEFEPHYNRVVVLFDKFPPEKIEAKAEERALRMWCDLNSIEVSDE